VKVQITHPVVQELNISLSSSGKLEAIDKTDLNFAMGGKISSVNVKEGDTIWKGQVLATLASPEPWENLKKAQLEKEKAIANLDGLKETYGDDIDSGAPFYLRRQAEKQIAETDAMINIATYLAGQQSLRSPINGTVIKVNIRPGEITSNNTAITVASLKNLYFELEVDEEDISKIKNNQEVSISLDAYKNESIKGKIFRLGNELVKDENGNNIIKVKVELTSEIQFEPIIGMTGNAEIIEERVGEVLTIPQESLHREGDAYFVYIVKNNKIYRKDVTKDKENEDIVEIKDGLSPEDVVISESKTPLKVGMAVSYD